jgi:hypothetical protein
MFSQISLNTDDKKGKGYNILSSKNYNHNYSLGRDEWQQDWKTSQKRDFSSKTVSSP